MKTVSASVVAVSTSCKAGPETVRQIHRDDPAARCMQVNKKPRQAMSRATAPLSAHQSEVAIALRHNWQRLGDIMLGYDGKLGFPRTPMRPGIYRIGFLRQDQVARYVGQTENLPRQFQHLRTPGPSQETNFRINKMLLSYLECGDRAVVDIIATDLSIVTADGIVDMDLTDRSVRRQLKYIAISNERADGAELLNRR